MKALFTKKSIIIASIAALIAVITIVSINVMGTSGPVTGIANVVTRPVRALAAQVASTFERIYSSVYRYDELMEQHERLLRRVARMEMDFREAEYLREENDRLRRLVDFRERQPDYEHEPVSLVNWSSSNWASSFTINRGYANSDIELGNGVTTEYGVLIGQVSEVGATNSTVITVLDTTFSAAAFFGDRGGTATIRGDFNQMRNGLLVLDRIDDEDVVLPGDSVVTSGAGDLFPAGLVVGEVVAVHRHPTGIGRYATVRPMLEIATVNHMFVITDFELVDDVIS